MDSDKYEIALHQGLGLATAFWVCVMLMLICCAYDHGKHVGRLESSVQELAAEKEVESEK